MKILLAEDDLSLSKNLVSWLEEESYSVDAVSDGLTACDFLRANIYDLLILDWQMPGMSGIELCRYSKQSKNSAYVIMLTGKNTVTDKVTGLDTGADDYLTKPFDIDELLARIRAIRRRHVKNDDDIVRINDLVLNMETRQLLIGDKTVDLKRMESLVLAYLFNRAKNWVSSEELLKRVWQPENVSEVSNIESVYVCLSKVRKKLSQNGFPDLIKASRKQGYGYEVN